MGENSFDRKAKVLALIGGLPGELKETIEKKLDEQGEFLVAQIKPAVPVSDDDQPGELRDSVEWHRNPNPAKIGVIVTEGYNQPNDPDNRKARANEFGRGGDNPMEAQPHFYPTYRAHKKKMSSRVMSAARKKIKEIWGAGK